MAGLLDALLGNSSARQADDTATGALEPMVIEGNVPQDLEQNAMESLEDYAPTSMAQLPMPKEDEGPSLIQRIGNYLQSDDAKILGRNVSAYGLAPYAYTVGQPGVAENAISQAQEFENKLPSLRSTERQLAAGAIDKELEVGLEQQMNDPNSDISKVAREQIKKIFPDLDVENLSAAQMQRLGYRLGNPAAGGRSRFQVTRYTDEDGKVKIGTFDTATGEIVDTGKRAGFAMQTRNDPRTGDIISIDPSKMSAPSVPAANIGRSEQKPEATQVYESLNPKQREKLTKVRDQFKKDTESDRDAILAADSIDKLIVAGKTMPADSVRSIQTQFARAVGEKGALSNRDVESFGGVQSIQSRIKQAVKEAATGKLTDENRKFMSSLAQVLKSNAQARVANASKGYVEEYANDTGLTKDAVTKLLNVGAFSMKPSTEGKTRVIEVSSGKPGYLPNNRLEEALKSGKYKRAE